MYHIGYVNANYLHDGKFAQAIGLLENTFDLLFIAEHWYQHHELRLSHPLVYCAISLPGRSTIPRPRGHNHGGIYLLVKPHIRPLIQSTVSSTHSITVSLPGLRCAAVYYPPYSLTDDAVNASLLQIGPVDLLLGDINTTFHLDHKVTAHRSNFALSARSLLFQKWAVNSNMIHVSDQLQKTVSHKIPDHVFSSIALRTKLALSLISTPSVKFPTDHKFLLHVQFHNNIQGSYPDPIRPTQSQPSKAPIRFHVQRLKTPEIRIEYQKYWRIMSNLFTSYKQSEIFDIDILDSILCSAVQPVAETVLGVYEPAESRKKPDITAKRLATQLDMPSSIQLLKRAQRASTMGVNLVCSKEHSTPMDECIDHYSKMFNPSSSFCNNQSRASCYQDDYSGAESLRPTTSTMTPSSLYAIPDEITLNESGLIALISIDKIKFQVCQMSTTSACGNDGITVIMLRHLLETSFTEHLCQLYWACLRKGQTPKRWNEALIFLLCKDKKKPYTANNSRPISILCLFRKIFESLILPCVRSSGNMRYSGIQAGFRSGYSTLTNVLTLHDLIESDAGSHIVFLDFASAFDSVGWPFLRKELDKQGMNPVVVQIIYQLMYHDMSFSVIVNGTPSSNQHRTCGLPQGSPLSPALFNRFINSLLETLNWQNTPSFPSALFFADDGVLISPTFGKAQHLLNMASHWADEHGMAFNIAKCGYLITHSASKLPVAIRPPLLLKQQSLPLVKSYKYLGVRFSNKGIDFLAQGYLLCHRVE